MPIPTPMTVSETARPRSCGANSTGSTAKTTGRMIAAPTPITARAAITTAALSAHAAPADAAANRARPISSSRRRP